MTNLQLIREMMTRFDAVVAQIKEGYPNATQDQIHTMAAAAMEKSLGLNV